MSDIAVPEVPTESVPKESETFPTTEEITTSEVSQEPFLSVEFDDQKFDFSSKDDVVKAFKEGTLRHQDVKKAMAEVDQHREGLTKKERDLETQMTEFMRQKQQYDPLVQFLKSRPDIVRDIDTRMKNPSTNAVQESLRGYTDTKLSAVEKKLQEIEEAAKAREESIQTEQQRKEVFDELSSRYPDFNKDQVTALISEIEGYSSLPSKQAMSNFAELLYYAQKGKETPTKVAEKMIFANEARQSATVPMGGSSNITPTEGDIDGDYDEITAKIKALKGLDY